MFGIDNVGVINQRNAPAIWTSPIADFPPNNIQGRLLLATDTVTLYVDLINGTGGVTNRAIIASGLIGNGNGTTINNTGTGDYSVDLGGSLNDNTNINVENGNLSFIGGETTLKIINGRIQDTQSSYLYSPIDGNYFATIIIPTGYLTLYNSATDTYYKIPVLPV